jgi:hypothetical protein
VSGIDRPTRIAAHRSASPKPPDERSLVAEIWQISHFGWVPEAAIRRSVIIAGNGDASPALIGDVLRQLLDRGWIEQRPGAAEESEWRLTDQGRGAVPRR